MIVNPEELVMLQVLEKYSLIWAVPTLKKEEKDKLESYRIF